MFMLTSAPYDHLHPSFDVSHSSTTTLTVSEQFNRRGIIQSDHDYKGGNKSSTNSWSIMFTEG